MRGHREHARWDIRRVLHVESVGQIDVWVTAIRLALMSYICQDEGQWNADE